MKKKSSNGEYLSLRSIGITFADSSRIR